LDPPVVAEQLSEISVESSEYNVWWRKGYTDDALKDQDWAVVGGMKVNKTRETVAVSLNTESEK
jgi:hypothetical protein